MGARPAWITEANGRRSSNLPPACETRRMHSIPGVMFVRAPQASLPSSLVKLAAQYGYIPIAHKWSS